MKIPKIQPCPGRGDKWRLLVTWLIKHDDVTLAIPAGYVFDLASIPSWARSIVQKTDRRTWGPALEHDYRYEYAIGTKKAADRELKKGLRANGVSWLKANIVYLAVRVGGKGAW